MRVLQINASANSGSTGRIAEEIGNVLIEHGHESYIAYGRGIAKSCSNLIKIGSDLELYMHGAYTLLTDKHGFASTKATEKFVIQIDKIKPDLIALHNLHGYYLNVEILFNYIQKNNIPVTWTFHDCWPFTGHCTHFENKGCYKWETKCHSCVKTSFYPKSFVDNSPINFEKKKQIFNSIKNLKIVTPSLWLKKHIEKSFLKNHQLSVINNGIDLDVFRPTKPKSNFILFVSNVWTETKGFYDIFKLRDVVENSIEFVIVGLSKIQLKSLPPNIRGIQKINNINQLVDFYSSALCLVNLTYSDNFPTVNIEALACGTPVITYDTGGSSEAIDSQTGFVVEKGNFQGIVEKIEELKRLNYEEVTKACRLRAVKLYDKKTRYLDYLNVFDEMVKS